MSAARGRVTVLGSFVVDLAFRTPHLPVAGETIKGSYFATGPGGKGSNQGVAAKRAGAEITMISRVGSDAFAQIAEASFANEGLDSTYLFKDEEHSTGAAAIVVDEKSGQNLIVVVLGASLYFSECELESAREVIESSDILLVQLEANVDAIENAIDMARSAGATIVLNPAPARDDLSDDLLAKIDVITPNETEAATLTGLDVDHVQTVDGAKQAARALLERGVGAAIVTLGDKGAVLVSKDVETVIDPVVVDAIDTTGAGDAFNGGLVTALAEGQELAEAAWFGNVVGALSVTKRGTAPAMPYRREIDAFIGNSRRVDEVERRE